MRKYFIMSSLIILFALGLALFSLHQTGKIVKEAGVFMPTLREEARSKLPPQLTPSRPEDYGIVIIDKANHPKTQEEWDELVSSKLAELKSQASPEAEQKIKEGINEEQQETEAKVKQVDEAIQKCAQILKQEPSNKEIRDKLERLMILKSIGRQLPNSLKTNKNE